MIRNIIFDWSGTLVDDLPAVLQATNYVFRQAGMPELTREQFRADFCLPFQKFYDRFTPEVPMDQLEQWFHTHFRQAQDTVLELPHARSFLEICRRRGVRLFVLSTVHSEHFHKQALSLELATFFERTYTGVSDKCARIKEVLLENKLEPRETLFVGDMEHDIDAAKVGGTYSCAVLTGYTGLEQLRASEPDLIVEHMKELGELLEQNSWEIQAAVGRPIATVGALIFDPGGQVLMVRTQKWSNLWGIPGGKIRFGETSVAALERELKEETGLDVTQVEFVLVQDCIHSREFYRDAHFLLLNYTCRCGPNPLVRLNSEAQEYRWLSPQAALDLAINQPTRVLLEVVLRKAS